MSVGRYIKTIADSLQTSSCIQLIGNNKLIIYGNAVEALNNSKLHESIETITFFYVHYIILTGFSICDKLKKFKKLRHLTFKYN